MEQPVVAVREGKISGAAGDGVVAFRGIPYAASPVGDQRFCPPVPHPGWDGVRDGTRPGPSAPQGVSRLEAIMRPREPDWDEDGCLTLNVWTPEDALGAGARPRPVLVWFHGGAFATGSGGWDWYDGGALAAAGDIVVVTANYRLGPLGYLWLPGADNLGSRDQAAVLEWIRDTIGSFGGDLGAITVGGQSAGAYSALALAVDPATSGLVHRVILQSGPWGMPARRPGDAAEITRAFLAALGIEPDDAITRLRQVPVGDLLSAAGRLTAERARPRDITPLFYPVLGGAGLPHRWPDAVGDGGLDGKQVLIGSTSDEMTAFFGPPRDDETVVRATQEYFGAGVTEIAAACAARGTPAYVYRFTRASTANTGLGAAHCAELPFVFGNLAACEGMPMLGPVSDADRALAAEMSAAFARFAATGDPGTEWPPYGPGGHIRTFGP